MNKEKIYDTQISPLMAQIIKICKKHKIGMIASFAIPTPEETDFYCTTALPDESGKNPEAFRAPLAHLTKGAIFK